MKQLYVKKVVHFHLRFLCECQKYCVSCQCHYYYYPEGKSHSQEFLKKYENLTLVYPHKELLALVENNNALHSTDNGL